MGQQQQPQRLMKVFFRFAGLVNRLFYRHAGGQNRPVIFDIAKTAPALLTLDQNYQVIQQELDAVLQHKDRMPNYHDLDASQTKISAGDQPDKNWKVFMLFLSGMDAQSNQALCPHTTDLALRIPGLFQAFFSILDAGKRIPAHSGGYLGYLRYHLPLRVPEHKPPSIRIKSHHHVWKEGQGVLFDDSWDHEVYNESADIRVVLIVDILRPMSMPLHAMNWLLNRLAIKNIYAKKVTQRLEEYQLLPDTPLG